MKKKERSSCQKYLHQMNRQKFIIVGFPNTRDRKNYRLSTVSDWLAFEARLYGTVMVIGRIGKLIHTIFHYLLNPK